MTENRRILLIDDTAANHDDFRRILAGGGGAGELERREAELLDGPAQAPPPAFELESAHHGREGLDRLRRALVAGRPFALAFVDLRMPPGWNGVETVERLWEADPRLQVVICGAHSDHGWEEVRQRLEAGDRLLLLKKPFDRAALSQLAATLTSKWKLARQAEAKLAGVEEALRLRSAELEALKRELVRARDEAQAASRVKSEFLANVSHEIRTPMNAVLGMTHLALLTELSPAQRAFIGKARAAAGSLMGLLDDILEFSGLEAGKIRLEQGDFLLEEVLEPFSAALAEKAQAKELRFTADLKLPPVPLVGDAARLERVLAKLGDNAVKFTDAGGVGLRVRVVAEDPAGCTLHFSVRDTGIGMAPDQLERLFRPFGQLDASSTKRHGGAGMGLALCREMVRLMGGELTVASRPGSGSEFSFSLRFGIGRGGEQRGAGRAQRGNGCPEAVCAESRHPPKRPLDHAAVRTMLDQMTALFDCDLDRALTLKELLRGRLEGTVAAAEFGWMERQIENFDFEGALRSRERIDRLLETARREG